MIEIRSYRRVFDLERRIYSVDTVRLNPTGVPARGLVYFAVIVATALALVHLPVSGWIIGRLPWYLADLALPALAACVLGMMRVDGRAIHLTGGALMRFWVGSRRLSRLSSCPGTGRLWRPGEILLLPDGSDGHMRRLRYTGPGAALVTCEHELSDRGPAPLAAARDAVVVRPHGACEQLDSGKVVVLARRARLLVCPGPPDRGVR